MKWTVLVSTVLCWVTVAYGDEEIVELPIYLRNFTEILLEQKSCVEEIISLAGNDLTDRFDTFSLAAYCAKKSRWTRNSGTRRLSDSVGNSIHRGRLTRRQTDWLYQLQNCAKPDCLDCWNISNCQIRNKRQSEKLSSLKFSEINSRIRNSQRGGNRVIRKEYRRLTDEERHKFHSAMNQLKTDLIDEMSKFDLFAVFHTPEQSPGAHFGAAFLPWHRELLKQFEVALRVYDSSVSLPYWDSSLDEGLPQPKDSIIFSEDFLGDGEGYIKTGPYKNWRSYHSVLKKPKIVRNFGGFGVGSLYKPADLEKMMRLNSFGQFTNCLNPAFELLHGQVHMWVGGHMADMPISANDPIFYSHHAFVDYQWEMWRQTNQRYRQREEEYVADSDACGSFHHGDAHMLPFAKMKNIDGLANSYTDEFYQYEPRPVCRLTNGDCRSPYLFCYEGGRCLSKVQLGGNCAGLDAFDSCYNSMCRDGICISHGEDNASHKFLADNVRNEESPRVFVTTSTETNTPQQSTIRHTTETIPQGFPNPFPD